MQELFDFTIEAGLTADYLRTRLDYNPETGELRWKPIPVTRPHDQMWNTQHAGKIAGCLKPHWRTKRWILCFRIASVKTYLFAHRVVWCMMTGAFPVKQVDHIDTDANNNKWSNLRLGNHREQARNRHVNPRSTTGLKGVEQVSKNRWRARIRDENGKRICLGYFDSPEAAHEAYCKAAPIYHGEFARTD